MSQGSTGSGHPPRPPYLPAFRSAPASRQTSRASSPRSTYSQALACHKAAPRAFKPDASPRPGLSTGDAVALQCDDGDRFFRVHAASTSLGEALGQGPALLRPCGRCGPADAHTHLEVVLSGEWLGLRSAAAGDRFLQARKHGAARLAFHSANLGTWEQWQLGPGAAEALAQPWETSQPLVLQHRRLPQVQLHVTLVRVGTFLPLSVGGSTTPRSLAPVPEAGMAGLEREKLRRISDVVVQEWFAYVDREKALRSEAEGRLADLTQTTAHLRAWAVEKVESLRSQVELDVAELLEAVRARSRELAGSQAAVEATRGAALAALAARRRRDACAAAFAAWRAATAAENRRRAWEAAAARRRVARLMGLAVDAWRLACEDAAHTKQLLRRAVEKLSAMRLRQAFRAWAGAVELRREQQALLRRAVAQSVARRQAAAFSSWRAWVEERREAAAKLEHVRRSVDAGALRQAFHAWRGLAPEREAGLEALRARTAATRRADSLRACIAAWRGFAEAARRDAAAAARAGQLIALSRARRALGAWRRCVADSASLEVEAAAHAARSRAQLALRAWRAETQQAATRRSRLVQLVEGRARALQHAALAAWRDHTKGLRLACATVARCLEGRAASLQAAALGEWREAAARAAALRRRGDGACERRARRSQAACLAVWREWMVGRRRERALMALALARADRQRAHGVLQALASNAEAARSERAMARQADRFGRRVLVGKALGAWLGARDARAALAATLARVGLRRQAALESEVLAAWRGWVGEVRAERGTVALVQAWQRRRRAALVWQAWREAHAAGRLAEDRAEALAAQVRANTAHEALLGWHAWVAAQRAQRAKMMQAVMRVSDLRLCWAFGEWRARAAEKGLEQERLQRAKRCLHRQQCARVLGAWRGAADRAVRQRLGVAEMVEGARRRSLAAILDGWRQVKSERAARLAAARRGAESLSARRRATNLRAALCAWRLHAGEAASTRRAVTAAADAGARALRRSALAVWAHAAAARRSARERALRTCVERRCMVLCAGALATWRRHTAAAARSRAVLAHVVERRALALQRGALGAWLGATRARRERRTALSRFEARWRLHRVAAAWDAWRGNLAEAAEARDRLRRCLLQKQTAFRLFRTWYWDAFDDDLQDTLRTIFELTEGSIADPLPSRPASPDAGRGVGGVGRRATGAEAGSPPHAAAPGLVGMPLAQQRRLTASVTRSLAAAGLAGASPGRGASPLPDIRARIDAAAAAGVASAARAWPGRGIAAARPAGEETAGDQQGAREGPPSKNELQSWVEEGPEGAIRAGWRSGEAAPTPPLPARGAYAGPAPGSWDPIPARSTAAALSAAPTPQPGPMPRDSAARRALALARTPLSAATPGGRWDGGPNERGASLSRQLAEAMEGEGAGGRTPLSAAKTPPGGYAGAGRGKENAALGYSPAWYQSMSPSQQYTADYLAAAATPSPPRAQDSGGSGPLGATPPLMHNPLSFAF